jgi:prevent-host-death family protein
MPRETYLPVSTAKSDLLEVLRRIEIQREKVIITKNGIPKAVLLNYEDFEGLLETIDILSDRKTLKGVRRGLADVRAGRVVTLKKAFED